METKQHTFLSFLFVTIIHSDTVDFRFYSVVKLLEGVKPFQPTDYEELMNPHHRNERVVLNNHNVFAYLAAQGYDTTQLVKRNDN